MQKGNLHSILYKHSMWGDGKMPVIVKPIEIKKTKKFWGIAEVYLTSIQELLELAEVLDIPVVLQESVKSYTFFYDGMKFIAKQ